MRASIGLSFLDVLCSAMGGAVVLAVIFATIKNPVQLPISDEFILIEIVSTHPAGTDQPFRIPGSGLRVTPPRGETWTVDLLPGYTAGLDEFAESVTVWEGAAQTSDNGYRRSVTYAIIRRPVGGTWELRPTMVRWRQRTSHADAWGEFMTGQASAGDPSPEPFQIESIRVWTRDTTLSLPGEDGKELAPLRRPGEAGQLIVVSLGAEAE